MEIVHPDDVASTIAVSRQVADGAPTKAFVNHCRHRDGTIVPIMWSAVASEGAGSIICIGRDMREHQRTEDKLRQAQAET